MEIIDKYDLDEHYKQINEEAYSKIFKESFPQSLIYEQNSWISLLSSNGKYKQMDFITKIYLINSDSIMVKSNLVGNQLMRFKYRDNRLLFLRKYIFVHEINSNIVKKLNPINGQVSIQYTYNLLFLQKQIDFKKIIQEIFQLNINQMMDAYNKLLTLINKNYCIYDQDNKKSSLNLELQYQNRFCQKIRNHIQISNLQTWYILSGKSLQQFKKQKDKKNIKQTPTNKASKILKGIYKAFNQPVYVPEKIIDLTQKQKNQLQQKYLVKIEPLKGGAQIQQLNLTKQQFNRLSIQGYGNFNSQNLGPVNLRFQKNKKQIITYQKQIIKKLSKNQFNGIAKFYNYTADKKQMDTCMITNIKPDSSLEKYLLKNSESISIFTKFYFIQQIFQILKYLRDNSIIFNNLSNFKVYISGGTLKIQDFSNSFHHQVNPNKNLVIGDYRLPTVVPYNFHNDERSDVQSLGYLIYYLIYNKHKYDAKGHYLQALQTQKLSKDQKMLKIHRIYKNNVVNIDKSRNFQSKIIRLLDIFIQKCTQLENIITSPTNNLADVSGIPFLDWSVIILKEIKEQILSDK